MGPLYDLQKYALSGKITRINNKSCRGYEGLSFDDFELNLELDLESHLKINIEFFNRKLLFKPRI